MMQEERRAQLLREQRRRLVVDAHAPLLEDDVALGQHDLVVEHQPGHAVRFQPHDEVQPVARDRLVKGGVVLGRERVVAPAVARNRRREGARRVGGRPLEHQMFEEMGDAGFSERVVGSPHLVPDHLHHGRDAMVRHDHHLHSGAERETLGTETLRRCGRRKQSQCDARESDQGDASPPAIRRKAAAMPVGQ